MQSKPARGRARTHLLLSVGAVVVVGAAATPAPPVAPPAPAPAPTSPAPAPAATPALALLLGDGDLQRRAAQRREHELRLRRSGRGGGRAGLLEVDKRVGLNVVGAGGRTGEGGRCQARECRTRAGQQSGWPGPACCVLLLARQARKNSSVCITAFRSACTSVVIASGGARGQTRS